MPVTYAELKRLLDVDEPDYDSLVVVAETSMAMLKRLADSGEPAVVAKAVSLAGLIGGRDALEIVRRGARSKDPAIRVAAAHAASFLGAHPGSGTVIVDLLKDDNPSVVKFALRAASAHPDPAVKAKAARASVVHDRKVRALRAAGAKATSAARAGSLRRAAKPLRGDHAGRMPDPKLTAPKSGGRPGSMPSGKME